jgi:hypothetical protein
MTVYRFGIMTDAIPEGDLFDSIQETFRSDVEQRHTPLALHDPDSNDLKLARRLADEIINISGAEVKIYTRTDNADYDAVWDSDPDPTYWNAVLMKGYFKPQPLEAELKKWGAEIANKTEIIFSHRQIFREFRERMLRVGDVIQIPYNAAMPDLAPKNYRVTNVTPSGNFRYHWLYLTCQAEVITADITVRPPDETPIVDDEPVKSGGVYRESL